METKKKKKKNLKKTNWRRNVKFYRENLATRKLT